jgi:hypothetical protein
MKASHFRSWPKGALSMLVATFSRVLSFSASLAVCIMSSVVLADQVPIKMLPLDQVQSLDKITYYFDRANVSAIYQKYYKTERKGLGTFHITRGPLTWHVWGIALAPVPIPVTADDFLRTHKIADKFVTLHSLTGEIKLRVTAIAFITAAPRSYHLNPKVKVFIYPGPQNQVPWQITDDLDYVVTQVDDIRINQPAHE